MAEKVVKAKKVREGDFLPGLDNEYVFVDAERDPDVVINGGRVTAEEAVLISYHDQQGDENYVLCGKSQPVTVRRG